jgi:hypothetical protein
VYSSPEHNVWVVMKQRCDNPNRPDYDRYGGSGITYAPEWSEFLNFYRDMGPRPSGKHTLGRVDRTGNYCKANCVWDTQKVQQNNKRNNVRIIRDGETLTLALWCERLNLNYSTVWARIKNGWHAEEALNTPTRSPFTGAGKRIDGLPARVTATAIP